MPGAFAKAYCTDVLCKHLFCLSQVNPIATTMNLYLGLKWMTECKRRRKYKLWHNRLDLCLRVYLQAVCIPKADMNDKAEAALISSFADYADRVPVSLYLFTHCLLMHINEYLWHHPMFMKQQTDVPITQIDTTNHSDNCLTSTVLKSTGFLAFSLPV